MGASSPEECLNWGWKNFVHHMNKREMIEEWEHCVEDGRDFKMFVKFITPRLEIKCAFVEAFAQKDKNGVLLGYVGCVMEKEPSFCET